MEKKFKILFLGETYRADAITWMKGLKEFGSFEIYTWELYSPGKGVKKVRRALELIMRLKELNRKIQDIKPNLIIGERVTSYGFIGSLFRKYAPLVIAQQGITDIFPIRSFFAPIKRLLQWYAFKHASLIHAWGEIMTYSMLLQGAAPAKIMIRPKGIDLRIFQFNPNLKNQMIRAIVTRRLDVDYRHEIILEAFEIIKKRSIPFELTIVGDGPLKKQLIESAVKRNIRDEVNFVGNISNNDLPAFLSSSDLYLSMPVTEGVSSSLLEAMASGCYPIVSDLPANRVWITNELNGRLIPVDQANQLANAIVGYAEGKQKLNEVRHRNRKVIEQTASYEKNMMVICNAYLRIIKQFQSCAG